MTLAEPPPPGAGRGLFGGRGYGSVLLLILAMLVVDLVAPDGPVRDVIAVVARGATLYAVVLVAGLHRRIRLFVLAAWAVSVVGALGGSLVVLGTGPASLLDLALVAGAPLIVFRDIARHPVVTTQTLLGALSVYLLVGLLFASAFGLIAGFDDATLFLDGDGTRRDHLYFSLITLTTVGYGDLVPGGDVGRITAALEALTGQIYLVTVVALVVGRLGHARRRRGD